MIGHLTNNDIYSIRWADSEIVSITINYDAVLIYLLESDGTAKTLICDGYIGYKTCGFWDEMIIESGSVKEVHPFIEECKQIIITKYKNVLPLTGNVTRNEQNWRMLEIKLIDNTTIFIVCGKLSVLVNSGNP